MTLNQLEDPERRQVKIANAISLNITHLIVRDKVVDSGLPVMENIWKKFFKIGKIMGFSINSKEVLWKMFRQFAEWKKREER